jgi:flavin-dependent dehydrogenase
MADPITGAGIHNAILACEVAGKTIIDALEKRMKMDACSDNELLQEHLTKSSCRRNKIFKYNEHNCTSMY